MALPSQIERAARGDRQSAGPKRTFVDDEGIFALPNLPAEIYAEYRREAARKLADIAVVQHPCELDPDNDVEVCTHADHQRDADFLRVTLEVLALRDDPREDDLPDDDAPIGGAVEAETPAPTVNTTGARNQRGLDVSWQERAACVGEDVLIFYGADGGGYEREGPTERKVREAKAKRICARCPVQAACREYAFQMNERYGVWGGLTEDERALKRRQWLLRRARVA